MIKLNRLLKLSADMICTIDAQGKFVDVSEASIFLIGYTAEELCGRVYTDFIDRVDVETTVIAFDDVLSGVRLQIQNHYLHKNGQVVPLRWSAQWVEEDQLVYAVARSGQITDQEENMRASLEESNQRYQYVSKATSDAIWDWDLVKGTLYWGENFETIFGYKIADISPGIESWTAHIAREDVDRVIKSIQNVLQGIGTNWKEEYRYQRADGSLADVVDRGFVIRDKTGKSVRMVGAMHDISERKQALKEMKKITEDLYKHNRELHEFGYIVSHNLRSPVANIMGLVDLLEMEKEDPETVSYCTNNLKKAISRMDEVIMDLSKILSATDNSVELAAEQVDLNETIGNIEIDLADKISRSHARITTTPGTFIIHSHKAYIYSIFFNLISNAIKYRADSSPVIQVELFQKDDKIQIVVTDNGRGIDLERHGEDLFKPYKRFYTNVEGKGLGMFLVKSHIDVLGGEIHVKSEPFKGTKFTILLPRAINN